MEQTAIVQEINEAILWIEQLTILRRMVTTPVIEEMISLFHAMIDCDANKMTKYYHSLTSLLLDAPIRRVTGDIWKDYLFAELIEVPNRFSTMATTGTMDPAVKEAMGHDLQLVQDLFYLNSEQIIEWIDRMKQEYRPMEQPKTKTEQVHNDSITQLAESAWFGIASLKKPQHTEETIETKEPETMEKLLMDELQTEQWIGWLYSEPAQQVDYIADEALALLYRKFLAEDDWGMLLDDLIWFFHHYGTGIFLRYRWFVADAEKFYGIDVDETKAIKWDDLYGVDRAKEKLFANVLSFLYRSQADNTILYGAQGMGKTSLATSIMMEPEMSELRFVYLIPKDAFQIYEIVHELGKQPFHFIVFLDEWPMGEEDYQILKRAMGGRMVPRNILFFMTAEQQPTDRTMFPLQISFSDPNFEEFQQSVLDIMSRNYVSTQDREIHEQALLACKQWREESDDFSIRSASRLADRLIREHSPKR